MSGAKTNSATNAETEFDVVGLLHDAVELLADLNPLARREVMQPLPAEVAETDTTVR